MTRKKRHLRLPFICDMCRLPAIRGGYASLTHRATGESITGALLCIRCNPQGAEA